MHIEFSHGKIQCKIKYYFFRVESFSEGFYSIWIFQVFSSRIFESLSRPQFLTKILETSNIPYSRAIDGKYERKK